MQTEETKDNGTKDESADLRCCNPEDFRKMFEKKCKCFSGQSDTTDFPAMKEGMMKKMMEMCCPSKTTKANEDTELQKGKNGETKST